MSMRYLLLCYGLLLASSLCAQSAKQNIRKMHVLRFKQPVEVLVRLNKPVENAEYTVIIERSLLPQLDTITLVRLLNHPGIYFAKFFTSSVPGKPARKYYMATPEIKGDGLYPFNSMKLTVKKLERPPKGKLYTRKEPIDSYNHWFVRKNAADMGINNQVNTLPNVDSVRVVYVIKVRERWKRRRSNNRVK